MMRYKGFPWLLVCTHCLDSPTRWHTLKGITTKHNRAARGVTLGWCCISNEMNESVTARSSFTHTNIHTAQALLAGLILHGN